MPPLDLLPILQNLKAKELNNLIDALLALRAALDYLPEEKDTAEAGLESNPAIGKTGYFEMKTVNGCGPYKYLRFRSEGKLKSYYLGKEA